jgi:pyruvate,orthophosphate dikinase
VRLLRLVAQSVYFFGNGVAEGTRDMKSVLGGKGANLAEMTNIGIPVPPGFTISCDECIGFLRDGKYSDRLRAQVEGNIARLEQAAGKKLGDPVNPLLVSVRSGAPVSMPGMMETILNLGLNDRAVQGLAKQSGNARFAFDSYRRFIQMYSDVVLGVPTSDFEHLLKAHRMTTGAATDTELTEDALRNLVEEYKSLVRNRTGSEFPTNPVVQLWGAIEAVWKSWTLKKARDYRRVNGISEDLGTAVIVVSMVFGNLGNDSGTGVAFTRNPSTGERKFYGEFLVNAQGEDVVAGIRTPLDIDQMADQLPAAYAELLETQQRLETHYRDMQDLEFTVERGKLFLLQTRTGKRTAPAAVRIARDMVAEGLIDKHEAVLRVPAGQLDQLLHPIIDPSVSAQPLCTGLPASPGAESGIAVFDPENAEARSSKGEAVILVRDETTPEDFHGIVAARAVLTARGGMTSHAAVVARGMGKCAVVGCKELDINAEHRFFSVNGSRIAEGDWLTIDGATGRVFAGNLPTIPSEIVRVTAGTMKEADAPVYQSYAEVLGWADEVRTLKVRANADTP